MTYDEPLFVKTLSEITAKLLTSYDVDEVLGDLATRVSDLFKLAGCGVSLVHEGRPEYVCAVPTALVELEAAQFTLGIGPCIDACVKGKTVAIADLKTAPREWADYTALAARLGVVAVASVPMQLGGTCFGDLDMFADRHRDWSTRDLDAARVMADMATSYLVNASTFAKQKQLAEQLQDALHSRVIIEQAKGMLASAYGVSVDEAFERIRTHARSNHVTLHAVSDAVVRLHLRP